MGTQTAEAPSVSEALRAALEASDGFRAIHERLLYLLQKEEDEDEQDFPTAYAYDTALTLLLDTQLQMSDLPRPSITADETGGIRLQWIGPERQVRLIVPADSSGREYVYFEDGESYDLADNPTPSALAQRLLWSTKLGGEYDPYQDAMRPPA